MTAPRFGDVGRMRYVEVVRPGGPDELHVTDGALPQLGPDDIRIHVEAAGVNRADIHQREGKYPPPSTASPILGLEVAGYVSAVGDRASLIWKIGDEVCALTDGGGYATEAVASFTQCLPIPEGLSMVQAASLPEAVFTVWHNVFQRCKLSAGETFLIHGGTSGIGVFAIQLAKAIGAKVIATVGSDEKVAACRQLGAEVAINYNSADFVAATLERTNGRGANVILDMVGGSYVERNIRALATDGRMANIAYMSGSVVTLDLLPLMTKRLMLTGSTMRRLPATQKSIIAQEVMMRVWPFVERGAIRPVIAATFPLSRASDAHRAMEAPHIGKIVLTNSDF